MNENEKEEIEADIEAKYVDKTEKEFLSRVTYAECLYILTPANKYCDKIKELSVLKICEIIEKLLKENEELKSDNLEYQRIQDIFDKRTYRKKYLEERRKEEPNLLYPDTDEIYRRYYELKKENQQLRNEYRNIQQDAYIQGRAEEQQKAEQIIYENYISKQIIKSKIEEIGEKIKYEENEKAVIYLHKQKNILQEVLKESEE